MKKILRIGKPAEKDQYDKIADKLALNSDLGPAAIANIIRAGFKVAPKPPSPAPVELELKLVQDTRINPDVVHLYVRGHDYPLMQFFVRDGKLTFSRFGSLRTRDTVAPLIKSELVDDEANSVIAETRGDGNIIFNVPSSAEAFSGNDKATATAATSYGDLGDSSNEYRESRSELRGC